MELLEKEDIIWKRKLMRKIFKIQLGETGEKKKIGVEEKYL